MKRLPVIVFLWSALFGSLYWLLNYIPFTQKHLLEVSVIPGLYLAARIYPFFYLVSAVLLLQRLSRSRLQLLLLILHTAFVLVVAGTLFLVPSVPQQLSLGLMLFQSGLLCATGLMLLLGCPPPSVKVNASFTFSAVVLAGVLILAIVALNQTFSAAGSLNFLALVLLAFPLLMAVRSIAGIFSENQTRVEQILLSAVFSLCIFWFVRYQVIGALGVSGIHLDLLSFFMAVGAAALLGTGEDSRGPLLFSVLFLCAELVLLTWALQGAGYLDWNFLTQKTLLVTGFFVLYFHLQRLFGDVARVLPLKTGPLTYGVLLCSPALLGLLLHFMPIVAPANVAETLAHDLLKRENVDEAAFYFFLQQNANLPLATELSIPDLQTPVGSAAVTQFKPDIYFFVIDSLRRDYLGAYNTNVRFTPGFDRFAAENLVFKNAFTQYGATGLSEAAIWAGAMIPHQSYPADFSRLNSLEKLLLRNDFENFISQDSILKLILTPEFRYTELDPATSSQELGLCQTLGRLQQKLQARTDQRPLFVYSQSQDLHVSVLARKSAGAASEAFSGFYPSYAESLANIDRCFGGFIDFLKQSGRLGNSVVVLTSDHGDSLGEDGRFGHAYTLFPEIVRVPLLLHLPETTPTSTADTGGVVFLTDIAPTLYQLLGLTPERDGVSIRGKSLLLPSRAKDETHLLVSSYGPVFALLADEGESLSIFDAVNLRTHEYRLSETGAKALPAARDSARVKKMKLLENKVKEWHGFYGFKNEAK